MTVQDLPIEQHVAKAVKLRHRLHQIPELGYAEFKTAAMLRAELDALKGVSPAQTANSAAQD